MRQNTSGDSDSVTSTGMAPTPLGNAVTDRPSFPGRAPIPPIPTFITLKREAFSPGAPPAFAPAFAKGRTQMLPALSAGILPGRACARQPKATSASIWPMT